MKTAVFLFSFLFILSLHLSNQTHLGRSPASEDVTQYGWKVTFEDEFVTKDQAIASGQDANCFSIPPQCSLNGWVVKDCDPQFNQQLRDLNKCNWKVYDRYNWMDFDAPESKGINSFHPSQVEVKNGNLILYASQSPIDRNQLDCKRNFQDTEVGWENFTKKCPIYSGAVDSRTFEKNGKILGFAQEYMVVLKSEQFFLMALEHGLRIGFCQIRSQTQILLGKVAVGQSVERSTLWKCGPITKGKNIKVV